MLAQYCVVLATHFPHLYFIVVQLVDGLPQEPALPQLPAAQARCIKTSGPIAPNCGAGLRAIFHMPHSTAAGQS